jgi:hypothetical protein
LSFAPLVSSRWFDEALLRLHRAPCERHEFRRVAQSFQPVGAPGPDFSPDTYCGAQSHAI